MKYLKILPLLLLALCSTSGFAQKWLDKISKTIDKVNEVTEQVTGETITTTTPKSTNLNGVTITSFHPKVAITVENCYRDGKDVIINYTMTNNLGEFAINCLGIGNGQTDKQTVVYDNLGNSYQLRFITFGNEYTDPLYRYVSFSPPVGITVNGTIEIANVNSRATSFKLVKMVGIDDAPGSLKEILFSLKNLPIQQWADFYISDVVHKKVEDPYFEKTIRQDMVIKSVSMTNNNTKVVIRHKQDENYFAENLWLNTENNNVYLEVDGKRYELLAFYGINRRHDDKAYDPGQVTDFTLVFEPLPEDTQIFDLYQKGGSFYNVFINPPTEPTRYDLPIAQAKGVVSLKDTKTTHDQRKRLTPSERSALKIDEIRNYEYFDSEFGNSMLSKGVQLYKGPKGSLETILLIVKGKAVNEYLMSYNAKGEFVDCIIFGLCNGLNSDRAQGSVKGSIVTSQLIDGTVTETYVYRIAYNGRFIKINED